MKPRFVVVSHIDYAACCGMARQLSRRSGAARAFRFLYGSALGLCGAFAGLLLLLRRLAGQPVLGRTFVLVVVLLLLAWGGTDGVCRLRGYFLLRRARLGHVTRRRYDIYDDGILDDTLTAHELPFPFFRYTGFAEDRARFYLIKDDECFSFDKRGFIRGTAEEFRLFVREELRQAALLYA